MITSKVNFFMNRRPNTQQNPMGDFPMAKGRRAFRYRLGGNLNALKGRANCGTDMSYQIYIAPELAFDDISVNYKPEEENTDTYSGFIFSDLSVIP